MSWRESLTALRCAACCKCSPFFRPSSCVFKCERVRINNSTLASDSPWSHEWNLGNNANHLRCDVDPAERNREQRRHLTEGKHLAKEPQRCTHTRPRAGAGPAAPYITMMKHSDQTRANPSFINVTAEAVVEKGPLSPRCPGGERNTSQHSLTCHPATPSIPAPGGTREHGSSEQTRPHKHLGCAPQRQNKTLAALRWGVSVAPAWLSGVEHDVGHSGAQQCWG